MKKIALLTMIGALCLTGCSIVKEEDKTAPAAGEPEPAWERKRSSWWKTAPRFYIPPAAAPLSLDLAETEAAS